MALNFNNLTFIIVTFKSEHVIYECINSLPINSKIIVIENSFDKKFKKDLEKKYPGIKVIIQENIGMGAANNKGIKICETDYAFVINPDVKFEKDTIDKLIDFSINKNNFAVLAPISDNDRHPNYNVKNKKLKTQELNYIDADSVDGYAMLINKKKFKNDYYFDENFFLYLENEDLCFRKKKEGENIYVLKTAKINHLGGKSSSLSYDKEIEYSRNWHWMWSKFYYNKKHYGYFYSLIKILPNLISAKSKFLYYLLTFNSHKKRIYQMRYFGLINSMLGKKSWYRPKI
jgi:N-acetylglucosaminyl-diphospho-decaprenol L-rhamnosyltransferase